MFSNFGDRLLRIREAFKSFLYARGIREVLRQTWSMYTTRHTFNKWKVRYVLHISSILLDFWGFYCQRNNTIVTWHTLQAFWNQRVMGNNWHQAHISPHIRQISLVRLCLREGVVYFDTYTKPSVTLLSFTTYHVVRGACLIPWLQ